MSDLMQFNHQQEKNLNKKLLEMMMNQILSRPQVTKESKIFIRTSTERRFIVVLFTQVPVKVNTGHKFSQAHKQSSGKLSF